MNKLNDFLETLAKPFSWLTDWILRLVLGIGFFLYGYGKLPLPPKKMVTWFESEGIPAPELVTSMVSIGEMAAGIGIILGGFFSGILGNVITRLSGGAVVVIMIGAFYIAHTDWFITEKLFKEVQIFLFALGAYFAIKGNN